MNPLSTFLQNLPLPLLSILPHHPKSLQIPRAQSPNADIEMIRNKDGSFSAKSKLVVVLWDLDNKPPRHQPYNAAISLRNLAELFGNVVEISAFANRHAFLHLPQWVRNNRRERHHLDNLERKGLIIPNDPYVCGVCGRKFSTNCELKRHFSQLHERERQKKLSRMRMLKGRRRERFRERFVDGNEKYREAAREILVPRRGYGLASELRRAGVVVKTVEDKPEAADSAVRRRMKQSVSRGVDFLVLVSDDKGFAEMIGKAREAEVGTVVVGDGRRALGRVADFWVPWVRVEKGEVGEEVLLSGRNSLFHDDDDVEESCGFGVSGFSEEEMWDGVSLSWTGEDEDDCYI